MNTKDKTFTDQIVTSMVVYPEYWKLNEKAKTMYSEQMWGTHIVFAGGRLFVKVISGLKTPNLSLIDKFRLYQAYKRWCKAPVTAEVSQEQYVKALNDELNRYRLGYKGTCDTCRPVGHRNKLLLQEIEQLKLEKERLWKMVEK